MSRYIPEQVYNIEDVYRESLRIEESFNHLFDGEFEIVNAEPDKPKLGMVKQADGVGWDPGSGAGIYSYEGTSTASASWKKLHIYPRMTSEGDNVTDFTKAWGNVLRFGAQCDLSADDGSAIQKMVNWAESSGFGLVYTPNVGAGYRISKPINVKSNIVFDGCHSLIRNVGESQTQAQGNNCFAAGMIHPSHYDNLTYYLCSNVSKGDQSITLSTPAEADNLTVGDPIMIRSLAENVSGSNKTPHFVEIFRVLAKNNSTGVVDLDRKFQEAVTSPRISTVNGQDSVSGYEDPLGNPIYTSIADRIVIKNFKVESDLQWLQRNLCYESEIKNIWVEKSLAIVSGNGYCKTRVDNIRGFFTDRFVEIKTSGHDSVISNMFGTYKEDGLTVSNLPLMNTGENCRRITYRDFECDASGWGGLYCVYLIDGSQDCKVQHGKFFAPDITSVACFIQGGEVTGNGNHNVNDVYFDTHTSTIARYIRISSPTPETVVPDNWKITNCTFIGSVSTDAAIFYNGDNGVLAGNMFENELINFNASSNCLNTKVHDNQCELFYGDKTVFENQLVYNNHWTHYDGYRDNIARLRNSTTTSTTVGNELVRHTIPAGTVKDLFADAATGTDYLVIPVEISGAVTGTTNTKTIRIQDGAGTIATYTFAAGTTGGYRISGYVHGFATTQVAYALTFIDPLGAVTMTRVLRTGLTLNTNAYDVILQAWVTNASDSVVVDHALIAPKVMGEANLASTQF